MALERLLIYIEQPDLYGAEAEAALGHINGCPICQRRVGYLVRALSTTEADALTCQECEELLPEYFRAETEGQVSGTRWSPVAQHLAMCPYCAAEYATLSDLSVLAYGERDAEPRRYPEPNLSFLGPKKAGSLQPVKPFWRLDEWGRLLIQFSAEFVSAWQPPVYGLAGLKGGQSSRVLAKFSLERAIEDLEVVITVEEKRDDPARCTIMVEVNIPSRDGWPHLAGTEVTIRQNKSTLDTRLTDAYGQAVFEAIPTSVLSQLAFEIVPVKHET